MTARRGIRAGIVGAMAAGVVLIAASPAGAVPPGTIGTFPTWTVTGASTAYTGAAAFSSPTLPSPTISSDSAQITMATGASAYLGAGTAFGAEYGSTRAQPYLTIRPRTGGPAPVPASLSNPTPSVTTIDFGATPPAAGWGFALGDIDADAVFVQGFDAGGPVDASLLHEQSTGNYCDTSPKPSTCSGVNAPFDIPHWVTNPSGEAAPATPQITWSRGTAYGNFADTTGAYVWFMPDASIRRITLTYYAVNGSPVYQLWLAQPAPMATINGTVALDGQAPGTAVPAGTSVQLNAADGTPVTDLGGDPVTVPVDTTTGAYSIVTEQRAEYQLHVIPPAGYAQPADVTVAALSATVSAPAITLDPATAAAPAATPTDPTLAESGVDAAPALIVGVAVLLLGAGLLTARRLRRR
jgi:hypothetical protein